MVYSRVNDGLSCGYSRFNPCWIKTPAKTNCHEVRLLAHGLVSMRSAADVAILTGRTHLHQLHPHLTLSQAARTLPSANQSDQTGKSVGDGNELQFTSY